MYVGHFALALAVKGRRPKLPLATCLIAATAPDLAMAIMGIFANSTTADAYSHSLIAVVALALIGGMLAWSCQLGTGGALWISALVASHLPADWVTSRLALWPHGPVWGPDCTRILASIWSLKACSRSADGRSIVEDFREPWPCVRWHGRRLAFC